MATQQKKSTQKTDETLNPSIDLIDLPEENSKQSEQEKPDYSIFINREISWLEFNKRVLEEALDKNIPLFERLKFLAIYFSNLDEFFMVRVGSLSDQSVMDPDKRDDKTGLTATGQLSAIFEKVAEYTPLAEEAYHTICDELSCNDIDIINLSKMSKLDEQVVLKYFTEEIRPLLSPQIIDRHHPFPFLKNKEQFIATVFEGKNSEKEREKVEKGKEELKIGIVPISHLPQYFVFNINQRQKVLFTADVVSHFVQKLYSKQKVCEKHVLRITRNADISVDEGLFDYDIDFRGVMQAMLKKRRRLNVVRLQFSHPPTTALAVHLCNKLKITQDKILIQDVPLDFSIGFSLPSSLQNPKKDLFYKEIKPFIPIDFTMGESSGNALNFITQKDMLLAFPYHSTKPFVDLLYEAGDDPTVISIKISLYRLANHSKIAAALAHAAEKGKEVLCVLELRARFDEQNNINYATMLEEAGCTVIYGLSDYKIHAKLCLITRKLHNKISYITQIGTGNYNEKTSELYTDLSLITSDPMVGEDASKVFRALCMGEVVDSVNSLWVAPNCYESNVLNYIQDEIDLQRAGGEGYVFIKVNSLNDMEIMEKLIEASQAGVKVDMCIRGICCLCPQVPGYTENIRIKSIVGRYLEHSRIFLFGKGEREKIYIGSGDLLNRNTRRRVEVFAEIKQPAVRDHIHKIIDAILIDNCNSWMMQPDGSYLRVQPDGADPINSHLSLHQYFTEPFTADFRKRTLVERLVKKLRENNQTT